MDSSLNGSRLIGSRIITSRHFLLFGLLALLAAVSVVISLLSGSVDLSLPRLLSELLRRDNELPCQVLR